MSISITSAKEYHFVVGKNNYWLCSWMTDHCITAGPLSKQAYPFCVGEREKKKRNVSSTYHLQLSYLYIFNRINLIKE